LVEEHLGIIPVKFGQNQMSGFREEDVQVKKLMGDDGRQTKAGHNSSPCRAETGELKNGKMKHRYI